MATLIDGPLTTDSAHDVAKRAISDLISIVDPADTPVIARFGIQTAPPAGWNIVNWPSTDVEVIQDELHPLADDLDGTIDGTVTTITVTDASAFHEGDTVVVGTEWMNITAIVNSTQVLTVTRGYASSTTATHADADAVTVYGNARSEGATNTNSPVTALATVKNFTQIFHEGLTVSRTQEKNSQYGKSGEMAFQMMKKTKEGMRKLERAILNNAYILSTQPRLLGGLPYWINSSGANTVSAGGAVTQADFEDTLEAIYNDSAAMNFVAVVNPANMQVIKNWYDSTSYLRIPRTETTAGMVINTVVTPFGTVELLMDRHQPAATIPILNPEHFAILAFDNWFVENLAKTADTATPQQLVGEFTCLVRHPLEAHGMVIAIS